MLNGAVTDQQLKLATRSPSATYAIPNENEWYKAAYYKGGTANAGYWLFPTQSDVVPTNTLSATSTNNANFSDPVLGDTDPINGLTAVGSFVNSSGSYGTYDMGGDVSQWNETPVAGGFGFRGGAFNDGEAFLASSDRLGGAASQIGVDIGFRVVDLPEPSISFLALTSFALLRRSRRYSFA